MIQVRRLLDSTSCWEEVARKKKRPNSSLIKLKKLRRQKRLPVKKSKQVLRRLSLKLKNLLIKASQKLTRSRLIQLKRKRSQMMIDPEMRGEIRILVKKQN